MVDKKALKKIFTPDSYKVELFKEKGFIRKKCSNCDLNYWTLDPDRTTCGETECEGGYKFIGRKGPNWDFHQTIANLTKFFEKNGHTPIEPYPVVARWRDDLEFTIASIATLQPYVTSGAIKPPANPLTIPQPCLRFGGDFNDLDNIGRTGRHLSNFVMFGQHAFNGNNLEGGYWMDRCIDLNFDFLTNVLKIEPDQVTYTENIWAGGGNFGPNLESMAYGTEIVNSVFMQYQNLPGGGYKEMDLKVIDVGWGAERVGWFSQGTPTIYESTFGPVWDYLLKESNLTYDTDLVERYAVLAGLLDVNEITDIKSARSGIAGKLGMTLTELNDKLAGVEALYAIGDHSRTVAFALADGAIPSNVGGGYNVRTVLRRMFTFNEMNDFQLDISELISRQITYVSQTYPRLKEVSSFIDTIVDVERARYKKTIKAGTRYVEQLLKSKGKFTIDKLIELYESRGISPELVQSIASEKGREVEIPGDFYNRLGGSESVTEKSIEQEEFQLDQLKQYKTKKRYYDIPYKREVKAKVLAILDTGHLVFDQTIFYPIGGGQAEDHGVLKFRKSSRKVVDVKKFGDTIVHKLDRPLDSLKEGSTVRLEVDWERRKALMRHHTAVHIVGGAARRVLGPHIWQAGADKTTERGRLDITHWENLSREVLDEIEMVANDVVMDNREIHKYVLPRQEAEQKYGFTIYQGGVVPGEELRIIEIPGIDTEACGGTHAHSTGDLGYIKILGAERIQDGIVRLVLTAGKKAVASSQHQYHLLSQSSETFSVQRDDLPQTAERFFREWKERGKSILKLGKELAEARLPQIIDQAKEMNVNGRSFKIIVIRQDGSLADLIQLGEKISSTTADEGNYIGIILGKDENRAGIVVSRSAGLDVQLTPIIRGLGKIVGGGGGGNKDVLSGGGSKPENIPEAIEKSWEIVNDTLSK